MVVQKSYSIVIGTILLALGVWGFFQQPILGIFGVNAYHSILHVLAGGLGFVFMFVNKARGFNLWLGWLALALGILGFIPFADILLRNVLGANIAISWLHIAIGIVSLLIGYTVKE